MGLLDSVIGAVGQAASQGPLGGLGQGGQADLMGLVATLLGPGGHGLAGLVQQFEQGGLGQIVQSWVGTGANLPISADQLGGVLGGDTVNNMAAQMGVNPGDLLGQLSQFLPQVVDQLTPGGQLPQGGGLGDLGGLLGGLLKR